MTRVEAKEKLQAYLECKTKQIKGIWEECNYNLCDNCDLCYLQGNNGEHKESIRLAIKSLEAWDEVISLLEYRRTVSDKCFELSNESYYAGKSITFKEAIGIIKQKLGEVENDRLG